MTRARRRQTREAHRRAALTRMVALTPVGRLWPSGRRSAVFVDALAAFVDRWGEPDFACGGPAAEGNPEYAIARWDFGRAEINLHEESPGVAAPIDVYIVARVGIGGSSEEWALLGTPAHDGETTVTPLREAMDAAKAWILRAP